MPAGETPAGSVVVDSSAGAAASSSASYAAALAPLTAALPTTSKIMSSADADRMIEAEREENAELRKAVTDLISALANANSDDVAAQTQALKRELVTLQNAQPAMPR